MMTMNTEHSDEKLHLQAEHILGQKSNRIESYKNLLFRKKTMHHR